MYPKPKRVRFKDKKRRDPTIQQRVLRRDGRCMWCAIQDATLVGHHIRSWGSSGIDTLGNVITLCFQCHDDAEHGFLTQRDGTRVYNVRELLYKILEEEYGYATTYIPLS